MSLGLRRPSIVAAMVLILGGCAYAFTPHELNLQPHLTLTRVTIGAKTNLYFRFVDERDDPVIGMRANGGSAQITAPTLPAVFETQLKLGLQNKGYTLATTKGQADSIVTFHLRSFIFGGADEALAVIAVDAVHGGMTYSNVYRFSSVHKALTLPSGGDIDDIMNEALNGILQKVLSDGNLDKVLTQKT